MSNSKYDPFETPIDMLPDELLNMIFNRINFHGHLRLSGVCKRWHNLVQNDIVFMRTVKFKAKKLSDSHTLMRSYKCVDLGDCRWRRATARNLRKLINNAEAINFGIVGRVILNKLMPMCGSLKEIHLVYSDRGDNIPLNFVHPLPVNLTTFNPSEEILDCFKVATNNLQFIVVNAPSAFTDKFMAKYGAMINSIYIDLVSNGSFDYWARFENLHLQYLCLGDCGQPLTGMDWTAVQPFFEKQAPSLKTIDIEWQYIGISLFDPIRMLLKNLETVKFTLVGNQFMRFNDLKVLPKLRCMVLNVADCEYYDLDIVELITLNELHISYDAGPYRGPMLRIISRGPPMNAMKKIEISCFNMDSATLKDITRTMPRLKELFLCGCESIFAYRAAEEFNKLIHLESLKESSQCYLTNDCLGTISLPELRLLYMGSDTSISQTTLDSLAGNCPKLLQLFVSTPYEPIMFARRINSDSQFRIVHKVRKTVDGNPLEFDYDSVESCSDENV